MSESCIFLGTKPGTSEYVYPDPTPSTTAWIQSARLMNIAAVTSSRLYSRVRIGRRKGKEGRMAGWLAGGKAGGFLGVGRPRGNQRSLVAKLARLGLVPLASTPLLA